MANLGPSESRISDAYSEKHIFLLIVTFYFTKTENRRFEVSSIILRRFKQGWKWG